MALRCVVALLAVTCTHAQNQYQNEDGKSQNNQDSMQPQFPTSTMPPYNPMVFPTFNNNQREGPGVNFQSDTDTGNVLIEQRGRLTKVITYRNGVIEQRIYLDVGKNKPFYINIESLFPRHNIPKVLSVKQSPGQNEEFNGSSIGSDLFDIIDEVNSGGEATRPTLLYITLALIIYRMYM